MLTFSDHTLQTDYVLVRKLSHDAGFTEKVLSLFFCVAGLQRLYGYSDFRASRDVQRTTKNFAEFS